MLAQHGDALHGVTVSIRKDYAIIQVWNKKAHPETEEQHIYKFIKANIIPNVKLTAFFYKRTLWKPFIQATDLVSNSNPIFPRLACRQHTSYAEDLKRKLTNLKVSQ